MVLNETWFNKEVKDNEVFPNVSYKVFRLDRSEKSHPFDASNPTKYRKNGGGVLIAVRSDLDVESRTIKFKNFDCKAELLSIDLKFPNGTHKCISTFYRVGNLEEENFNYFDSYIKKLAALKNIGKITLVGDLNLNGISWPNGLTKIGLENKFLNTFDDVGFKQLVKGPTHRLGNTLDLILNNSVNDVSNVHILNENVVCNSDHFAISFNINVKVKRKIAPKRKIFKKAKWDKLNEDLNKINWQGYFNISNAESNWIFFKNTLLKLCHKHIPVISVGGKIQPPWFDCDTFYLCREKERLRTKFKKSNDINDYDKFKAARKKFVRTIREKQRANFSDPDDPAVIPRKFWRHVKFSSNSTRIPEIVSYAGRTRNNFHGQAELFNEYFFDQFSEPSKYNIPIDICDDSDNDNDFHISRFGILKLLQRINSNKAAGPDGIHGKILKNCSVSLALPLSLMYNICYRTGVIPKEWKSAFVVPVHKKDDKSVVENYRPISLTCLVMKTFEVCIRDEIMSRCNNLINTQQHGFLPEKSCTTQMVPFVEDLAFSLNKGCRIDIVYFDFAKAFDSVNHDIILEKLKNNFNINGKLLRLIQSYLKDRSQCVVVGGTKSNFKSVLSGVPQGSIIGPLLFVLFINDLSLCVNPPTNIVLYADDTKIWRVIDSYDDHTALQKDIDALLTWANINKMIFHPHKCKILTISNKIYNRWLTFSDSSGILDIFQFPFFDRFPYCLGENCLDYVKSEKDLGVHINSKLNWSEHCKILASKANSMFGLIKRTGDCTNDSKQRKILYISLVLSQLNYNSVIWRPFDQKSLSKFEAIQKRAVKWMLFEGYQKYSECDYLERLHKLDLLPINSKFLFTDLLLFHRIVNCDVQINLPGHITKVLPSSNHQACTRSNTITISDDLMFKSSERCNVAAFSNSFFCRSYTQWNLLPLDIRKCKYDIFKVKLKAHLWSILLAKPD